MNSQKGERGKSDIPTAGVSVLFQPISFTDVS